MSADAPRFLDRLTANVMTMRSALMRKLLQYDDRRDINAECGYPETNPTAIDYRSMYDRHGVAQRVVNLYPEERWRRDVNIMENREADQTDFERTFDGLQKKCNVLYYIQRLDKISGIGRFGVMLFGLNDGLKLDQPVKGFKDDGTVNEKDRGELEVTFIRVFDESLIRISEFERDERNPRFGLPKYYTLKFADPTSSPEGDSAPPEQYTELKVHWSRVVHAADNRVTSEIIGASRQLVVWDRLLDMRKIFGGNGEMYWRGAFNGISLESHPNLEDVEIDVSATRDQLDLYMNGLQRYLVLSGMSAKSLAPNVASPEPHFKTALLGITIPLACPYRVFVGSEQASQASTQDIETWRGRMNKTNTDYTGPQLVVPVIQRLIDYGAVAPPDKPEEGMEVGTFEAEFPDLNEQDDTTKIENSSKLTEAIAKYIQSGASELIPEKEFLTMILNFDDDEAEAILEAAEQRMEEEREAEMELASHLEERISDDDTLRLAPPEGTERIPEPGENPRTPGGGAGNKPPQRNRD